MVEIIFLSSNVWVYLFLLLLSLFFMIKYKQDFKGDDLINSFIYLTNKINLLLLFIIFLFLFLLSFFGFSNIDIKIYFESSFRGLLYYSFFSYVLFFGLKTIEWVSYFVKDNDLFSYSLFKDKLKGGELK